MRHLFGWVSVCGLALFAVGGCASGNGGPAGGGGVGGIGGSGGVGGTGGAAASPWVFSEGGPLRDRGGGIAAMPDGSFVLAGMFQDTVTFGAGQANETTLTSAGVRDVYVARYDGPGSLRWIKRAGGMGEEVALGVGSFADGSFVVCGPFQQTATFGPNETNETDLTSVGLDDVFAARYNRDGTLAWAKRAGGSLSPSGSS